MCACVVTDSEKYAEIEEKFGADVPFLRDVELAGDVAVPGCVTLCGAGVPKGKEFELVTLLQPTSPMRNARNIREAYEIF